MKFEHFVAGVMTTLFVAMVLGLMLFSPKSRSDMSTEDMQYQGVLTVLWVADWMQTRDIAKNPDRYYETNRTLGNHPSVRDVDQYMAGTLALNWALMETLPADSNLKRLAQRLNISVRDNYTCHNSAIGLGVRESCGSNIGLGLTFRTQFSSGSW